MTNQRIQNFYSFTNQDNFEMARYVLEDLHNSNEVTPEVFKSLNHKLPSHFRLPEKRFSLKLHTMAFVPLTDLAPREFLIKRFRFEKGCLINICGTGASGKTMLAQYMALCINANLPLFGKFMVEPGTHKILHIDQEQTESLTQRRYTRLAVGLGIKGFQIDRTKLPVKLDDPSVSSEDIKKELVSICRGYSMVILDSLRQSTLCDENNSQIADVVSLLKKVAEEANTVFVFIHHKGKSVSGKQSGRGSSAIYDNEDIQMDLDADPATGIVKVSCAKNRDGVYFQGFDYQMQDEGEIIPSQDCTTELKLSLISEATTVTNDSEQRKILQSILDAPDQKKKHGELYELSGGSKASFKTLVESMIQQKLIAEAGRGENNSRWFALGENAKTYMDWEYSI